MRMGMMVLTLVLVRTASAQPAPEPSTEPPAATLFREGRALLDANQPAEACAKFATSLELDATAAGTMLNLGLCNEQLDKLATAIRWYRKALVRATETDLAETRAAAEERSKAIVARVATIKVEVRDAPLDAIVTVDGNRVESLDLARLELDAGIHVFELTGTGIAPIKRELDIANASSPTLALVVPAPVSPPKPIPPKQYTTVDPGRSQRVRAYIVGGAGLGVLAATAALGFIGRHNYLNDEDPANQSYWKDVLRYHGTSMFLVGTAAVTYGVLMYVRAPSKRRVEVAPVAPMIGNSVFGVSVTRPF